MVGSFLSQTWPNKELIIIDDGDDNIADLLPLNCGLIRYYRPRGKRNIPVKRNLCAEQANGKLIAHFDDDDWSAPERLDIQFRMLTASKARITGFRNLLFWDQINRKGWKYMGAEGYACGTSFFYTKDFWKDTPFKEDVPLGSDNEMIYAARRAKESATFDGERLMVARLHSRHSNSHDINGENYKPAAKGGFPKEFFRF